MTPASGRTRVAILGGGPAALAAAFELTATQELRNQYEVTVHQLGWRLGGKGASGRNAEYGQRIQEHGLHIWFGFYNNAFSMMRQCYEELGRPADAPLATLEEAFEPTYRGVQYEPYKGAWVPHDLVLPPLPGRPGDFGRPGVWEVVTYATRLLMDKIDSVWEGQFGPEIDAPPVAAPVPLPPDVDRERVVQERHRLGLDLDDWERMPAHSLLELAKSEAEEGDVGPEGGLDAGPQALGFGTALKLRFIGGLLRGARDVMWNRLVSRRVDNKDLRFYWMCLDLAATIVTGIDSDGLRESGFGKINDEEFRHWLGRHGASELTLEGCPLVRAVYSAAFCYLDGDVNQPNVAAGKAAQDAVRLPFFYKDAPMFKMTAGMGDTVFGPLYEVLHERGVRFEFFRWITHLGLSPDHRYVDSINFVQQARVEGGGEYKPLVPVEELPCWPSEPCWDQLEGGDALRAQAVDFEREPDPPGSNEDVLRRGDHFDIVVLGIPVGALPAICGELAAANNRFEQMLDNSRTVMTQAFQVWMKRGASALGNEYPDSTLTSCYVEPLDTYCDMSQTLAREEWPAGDDVNLVAYFCGVLPEDNVTSPEEADEQVRANAIQYFQQHISELWPGFAWNLMVDPDDGVGVARFGCQYWRANFTDSERYAQTPAGSVQYRLWPNESGFENLALAGDWTRNGIDGGAVEAAVISGRLASYAICGSPEQVDGVSEWLTSDEGEVGWMPMAPGQIHA